jgi:hypothetical protein
VSAIDVSDPLHPKAVGNLETIAVPMSVTDLSVHRNLCSIATEQVGLYVYKFGAKPEPE